MSAIGTTPEGARVANRKRRAGCGRCSGAWRIATISPIICSRRTSIATGAAAPWCAIRDVLKRPDARVLDLACGTGDLLIALERAAGRCLIGSDFCHPDADRCAEPSWQRGRLQSALLESDALALPFADASLDLITIAFGYRNLANYRAGLLEMRRVLRPGGALAILEFTAAAQPAFAAALQLVFAARAADGRRRDLGRAGGVRLPARIGAQVSPTLPSWRRMMTEAGFAHGRLGISDVRDCRAAHRESCQCLKPALLFLS